MCAVCTELAKGTITKKEGLSALNEVISTSKELSEEEFLHFRALENQLENDIKKEDGTI